MKCKTRIEFNEYLALFFSMSYKRWPAKIITVIALLDLLSVPFYINSLGSNQPPIPQITIALLFLGGYPLLIYLRAQKSYFPRSRFSENLEFEIFPEKLIIRGESFQTEMDLKRSYKIEEIKNWFLVYQNQQIASFIPKRCFDEFEIAQIRDYFKDLSSYVKVKLL